MPEQNNPGIPAVPAEMAKIFSHKQAYHQQQARLPIEEKVRILIELQKMALTVRPKQRENDQRRVWQLHK